MEHNIKFIIKKHLLKESTKKLETIQELIYELEKYNPNKKIIIQSDFGRNHSIVEIEDDSYNNVDVILLLSLSENRSYTVKDLIYKLKQKDGSKWVVFWADDLGDNYHPTHIEENNSEVVIHILP